MAKLEFKMARGGVFTALIYADKVPKTWAAISTVLPVTLKAYNARWSGRETTVPIDIPSKPPRENQCSRAGIGDVIYAREFPETRDITGFEAIAWFYGAENINDWRGQCPQNIIGRVSESQWDLLVQVGLRTWKEGGEDCTIRLLEE
jgi:uncharacterized protein DUF3830